MQILLDKVISIFLYTAFIIGLYFATGNFIEYFIHRNISYVIYSFILFMISIYAHKVIQTKMRLELIINKKNGISKNILMFHTIKYFFIIYILPAIIEVYTLWNKELLDTVNFIYAGILYVFYIISLTILRYLHNEKFKLLLKTLEKDGKEFINSKEETVKDLEKIIREQIKSDKVKILDSSKPENISIKIQEQLLKENKILITNLTNIIAKIKIKEKENDEDINKFINMITDGGEEPMAIKEKIMNLDELSALELYIELYKTRPESVKETLIDKFITEFVFEDIGWEIDSIDLIDTFEEIINNETINNIINSEYIYSYFYNNKTNLVYTQAPKYIKATLLTALYIKYLFGVFLSIQTIDKSIKILTKQHKDSIMETIDDTTKEILEKAMETKLPDIFDIVNNIIDGFGIFIVFIMSGFKYKFLDYNADAVDFDPTNLIDFIIKYKEDLLLEAKDELETVYSKIFED